MATTEQFSLRWNNFHSNLTSGFHELLEAADMVDVTLAVDGHFLQAHKIVLSICSPFFKQMFKVNPCKHPIVILKDVGHEHMKDILEFMYMGQVSVLRENLTQFLRTAELLQVKGLTGDDSGDDTSSTKDVKSVCDNEDESDIYNQLIEADMELPLYQPNTQPNVHQSGKRVKNINCSTNTKRAKCDYPQSKPSPAKEEFEPLKSKDYSHIQNSETPNINNSFNTTTASPESEAKEPLNMKVTWFGSESSIGDQSLGEQAAIGFSTYILEVCCFSITICIPNVNLLLTYRRSSPVFGIRYKYITSSGGQMSSMICKCF
ncbi:unnamed protein product [Acanthoscelides obtectus]|uniref:BTB domain-containing protein n=2 Tax=Acanthoscelides obtectus TaxID=200917 RepID=A0A9P0MA06_ACAOB|nr:unnamed protein product [Acanthoscelides obtectus]CAK1638801.1 Modifier of mdg4 [Acanthoscelides obtectus]